MSEHLLSSDVLEVLSSTPPLSGEQKRRLVDLAKISGVEPVQYDGGDAYVSISFTEEMWVIVITCCVDSSFFDVLYYPSSAKIDVKRGGRENFLKFLEGYEFYPNENGEDGNSAFTK